MGNTTFTTRIKTLGIADQKVWSSYKEYKLTQVEAFWSRTESERRYTHGCYSGSPCVKCETEWNGLMARFGI